MKNLFNKVCCNNDIALVIIRIALGSVFIVHGWAKVADLAGTAGFFASIGLPAYLAYVVAFIELIGGIMIVLGVYARIAAIFVAAVMIGAIVSLKWAKGFSGGWEFDLVLLLNAIALFVTGSGRFSLLRKDICCCESNTCVKSCDTASAANTNAPKA